MKTLLNKFLLLTFLSLTFWGCEKEGTLTQVGEGTPAVLSTSVNSVVLTKPNIANTAITLSFTAADFGYSAAVTNTLQIAKTGTNFASIKEFTLDNGVLTKSFTVLDLNSLLLSMNLSPGVATQVDVRIKSTISTAIAPVYSNVKVVSVTPFALVEQLYVAGQYQSWDPPTADSLTSATGNGIYVGTIKFDASLSGFKLLKKKSWGAPEYGRGTSDGSGAPSAFILVGGQDLRGPTTNATYPSDNYEITADLNTNTIAYALNTWCITGSATPLGWPDDGYNHDTIMKFNNTTKVWSVTVNLVPGAFKFRKNHGWTTNYGNNGTAGTLGGSDISVAVAGNYTITLNLSTNSYTLVKN